MKKVLISDNYPLFRDFLKQKLSEEEIENAQEISKKMTENELTAGLMEKERQLNQVITDINGIIMKPIQEIYQ